MILLDTGPLVASLNYDEPQQRRAEEALEGVFSGEHGAPFTVDHVFDEGLTLIRSRVRREGLARAFVRFFDDAPDAPALALEWTSVELHREALDLFFDHWDRGLSFTDCALIAHARRRRAKILTFDTCFDGLIEVVRP